MQDKQDSSKGVHPQPSEQTAEQTAGATREQAQRAPAVQGGTQPEVHDLTAEEDVASHAQV